MIATLLLVAAMYTTLCIAGWCVLAPVADRMRNTLLPAAPVLGAAVIAAVSSTATRWLTIAQCGAVVLVVLAGCLAWALRAGRTPWRPSRRAVVNTLLAPLLTVCGVCVVALPTAWVGDSRPVADTMIVDQYYYASNATYLTDHAMLPGPYWNVADWAGSASPSEGPVVDVIANRLRYGQASVASLLSLVVHHEPAATVTPVSIMWLVVLGSAVFAAAALFGVRRRWAAAAVPLVTSSLYLTTQSLEGKNDGLLGVSIALLALALSFALLRDTAARWPLVVVVAGLAATYSELVLVLVAPVALLALVGPWRRILERVNLLAGAWAVGAVLTPWAWIWLAQSARIGGRYSDGATPFDDRSGLALLRAVAGAEPGTTGGPTWVFSAVAVVSLAAVIAGLVAATALTSARGAVLGLVLAVGALELSATRSDAGNLQYRTAQLGYAFLLVLAVVGWDAVLRRRSARGRSLVRPVATGVVLAVVATFSLANAATAVGHLPKERALVQHVPQADLDAARSWVRDVGAENVSVIVPRFTDVAWLALALRDEQGVGFPVLPAVYLGSFPHWDRRPDAYYLVGAGATLAGDVTVVHRSSRFQLVELGPTGMILAPFQPTFYWGRTTFMRGYPCARDGAQMLLVRGSRASGTFALASMAGRTGRAGLALDIDGVPVAPRGVPVRAGRWSVQTFTAPRFTSAIINLHTSAAARVAGTTALPVTFGDATLAAHLPPDGDDLADFCLADQDDGMDGYDSNITLLRSR